MSQKNLVSILVVAVVILLGTTIYFATISNVGQPTPTTPNNNNVTNETPEQITKIIQEISVYCEKNNIPECLPITSYSVVDLNEKYSVVKIGNFNYLLTKKDGEWNVSIASQENNICKTGSGNTDLVEYCKQ